MNEPRVLMWKVRLSDNKIGLYDVEGYINIFDISSVFPDSPLGEYRDCSVIRMKTGEVFTVIGSPKDIVSDIAEWVNSHGR